MSIPETTISNEVRFSPLFLNSLNVKHQPLTPTPLLAVIMPTESILVTSSYVNVPPTETFPVTERVPPLTFVLIATLLAFKFKLLGLIVGVPEAPID